MGGSILQLVAVGIENVYLTSDPEITPFKTIYRRHTNFTKFEQPLYFRNKTDFGKNSICPIRPHADLLSNLLLVIELSDVNIFYKNLTITDVVEYLAGHGITWEPTGDIFTGEDIEDIQDLITAKIVILNNDIDTIDQIINPIDGTLLQFVDDIETDTSNDAFLKSIVEELISTYDDENEALYKLFTAFVADTDAPDFVTNSQKIKTDMIDIINSIIITPLDDIGLSVDVNPTAFEIFNQLFNEFSNTETYMDALRTYIDSLTHTQSLLSTRYAGNDALKIITSIKNDLITSVNTIDATLATNIYLTNDIWIKPLLILYYNIIQTRFSINNVFKSVGSNVDMVYSKQFNHIVGSKYTTSNEFRRDKFNMKTFDSLIENVQITDYLDDKPDDITIAYATIRPNALKTYYKNNNELYDNPSLVEYLSDINLWDQILPDTIILTGILSADEKTDLTKIMYMDFIPLFTIYDLNVKLQEYMTTIITDIGERTAMNDNINDLYVTARLAITEVLNLGLLGGSNNDDEIAYVKNLYLIKTGVSNTDADFDDKLLVSSFRKKAYITYDITSYNTMEYIRTYFTSELEALVTAHNDLSLTDVDITEVTDIIDLYYTSIDSLPSYSNYESDDYTIELHGISLQYYSVISSIYNYIYVNQITLFNTMYNTDLFEPLKLISLYSEPIDYIYENILGLPLGTDYIDYYTLDVLDPVGDTIKDQIDTLLTQLIVDLYTYTFTFINSNEILSTEYIPIDNSIYYYNDFDSVWTKILDFIEINYKYDHSIIDFDDIKAELSQDTIDIAVPLIKTYFADIVDGADSSGGSWTYDTTEIEITNAWNTYIVPTYAFVDFIPLHLLPTTVTATNIKNAFDDIVDALFVPNILYADMSRIINYYNGFTTTNDVFDYTRDKIFGSESSYSELYGLIGQNKQVTYDNIYNYYVNSKLSLNTRITTLTDYSTNIADNIQKTGRAKFAWIERLGYNMIDKMELHFDGEIYDSQIGKGLDIREQLSNPAGIRHNKAIDKIIGNVSELTTYDTTQKQKYTLHMPLHLFFNSNKIGNALPLVAMNHTNIDLHIKYKNFDECAYWDKTVETYFKTKPKLNAYVLGDYFYVDKEERHSIVSTNLEYLIEQVQHNNGIITQNDVHDGILSLKTDFKNVCKQFIWTLRFTDMKSGDKLLPNVYTPLYYHKYNISDEKRKELDMVKCYLAKDPTAEHIINIKNTYANSEYGWYFSDQVTESTNNRFYNEIQITFNGTAREQYKDADYYNYLQPFKYNKKTPTAGIYAYSLAEHPELLQPSGGANCSYIPDVRIDGRLEDYVINELANGRTIEYDIYAVSYNHQRIISGLTGLVFYS